MPCEAKARIVSHAVPSPSPLYPKNALLILSGAMIIAMGIGACVSSALPRLASCRRKDHFVEQPRALGQARTFARFNDCPRLNPGLTHKIGPEPVPNEPEVEDLEDKLAEAKIIARILAVSARASQGIRILTTSLEPSSAASRVMLNLARGLARKARSIAISLDTSAVPEFAGRAGGPPHWSATGTEPALGELLAGTASFSEVIRRDPVSRLHYLPIGNKHEIDLHQFTAVLDALGATYDFIIMIAPPTGENETAKMVAATTDVAVLAVLTEPGGAAFEAERQLIENGAREVLLVALAASTREGSARDVARVICCKMGSRLSIGPFHPIDQRHHRQDPRKAEGCKA
jgi:Mrp family chromosome partitioning ATPase